MDISHRESVFAQYINQYQDQINNHINVMNENRDKLPFAFSMFLFSIIDYYSFLYVVAVNGTGNKKDSNNFKEFMKSDFFPENARDKGAIIYFLRNGLMHQIFPKASSVWYFRDSKLFIKDYDAAGNVVPCLNIEYLCKITLNAIHRFEEDLRTDSSKIENLYNFLIADCKGYALGDHKELYECIEHSYDNDIEKIFT